jgi:uncharacterized protein YkwD/LysM repeat protein
MRKLTLWIAFISVVSITITPNQVAMAKPEVSASLQGNANDLIAAVNALRVSNGLPAYAANSILMQVAQDQANYMAATGQIAHRPGLTQRILDAGYPLAGDLSQGGFRAENITGGNKTAAQAVQEWTGDSLHLNTMLSPNLTEIGAGVAKVGDRYFWVIDCAQPTTNGIPQAYSPSPDDSEPESFSSSDFIVPVITSTPDENGLVYHEVQYGQTLWAIAIEYGVKIDEIRVLNNLGTTTEIYPGDKLLIRKDALSTVVPATSTAEITKVLTATVQVSTATSLSVSTLLPTETPTPVTKNVEKNSTAGIAVGVVLITLLLIGMLTWMASRRSA